MQYGIGKDKQRGAVSLFIVIFSALLITTITVAFVRIMVQNQQQATTIDLSKSALDSAYAGVEDAKRVIVDYQTNNCSNTSEGTKEKKDVCKSLADVLAVSNQECNTIQESGIFPGLTGEKEVIVEQKELGGDDQLLQQAYTCVKIKMDTLDYEGKLIANETRMIQLKSNKAFNKVRINWFVAEDLQTELSGGVSTGPTLPENALLPKLSSSSATVWPKDSPPLIRTQLIQFGDKFQLSDFDDNAGKKTNNATLFLIPSKRDGLGGVPFSFADNKRKSKNQVPSQPVEIKCEENFDNRFACSATVGVPDMIGSGTKTAYLLLSAIYNTGTTFSVEMLQGNTVVSFDGIQPEVDSTGRANDLFRRVKSRVETGVSSIPPVEAAVDISGSLCKAFYITASDYRQLNSCSN